MTIVKQSQFAKSALQAQNAITATSASFASTATSASYAGTASYVLTPIIPSLQQVVNVGNSIVNFGGTGNASLLSVNFTNNRTLYLNDNSYPTIRLVDNNNSSNNLQIDIDTISLDGTPYNWSDIVSNTSSYAETASYLNSLHQDVNIFGNLMVTGNLNVLGTASFIYTTQSIVDIGAGFINLNTDYPAAQFGGINVVDSGSFGNDSTGSLLWDSLNNKWIYSNPSGSSYSSGMLISGPRNTGSIGNEQGTTLNALMKGQGGDHITSSGIFEVSGSVGIGTSTPTSGSLIIVGAYAATTSAPLVTRNTTPYGGAANQYSQVWLNAAGGVMGYFRNDGRLYTTNDINSNYIIANQTGNAGTPIIRGPGTSGLFFPATNGLAITTNGTEALRVFSNQNISIGTTTDGGYKLDVNGTGRVSGIFVASDRLTVGGTTIIANASVQVNGTNKFVNFNAAYLNGSFYTYQCFGGYEVFGTDSALTGLLTIGGYRASQWTGITFHSSGSERMRIATGGNVLIGTTTDAGYKLDVNGTTRLAGNTLIASAATQLGTETAKLKVLSGYEGGVMNGILVEANGATYTTILRHTGSSPGSLYIDATNAGLSAMTRAIYINGSSALTNYVTFAESGTPRFNISRAGTISLAGDIYKNIDNSSLALYGGSDGVQDGFIKISGNSYYWGMIQFNMGYDANNSKMTWTLQDTTELMRLTGGGSLLINTTSSAGYKLDVSGSTRTNNFRLNDNSLIASQYTVGGTTLTVLNTGHNGAVGVKSTSAVGVHAISSLGVSGNNPTGASVYAAGGNQTGNISLGLLSNRALITSTTNGLAMHTSSMLQVDSTIQGFLPPRTNLTSNITTPAQGLMTYLTGSINEGLYYYNSGSQTGWHKVLTNIGLQNITGSLIVSGTYGGINTTFNKPNLFDANGIARVDWSTGTLTSVANDVTVDWENKILYDSTTNTALDWENKILSDSTSANSINWENRTLLEPSNTWVALDFSNDTIVSSELYNIQNIADQVQRSFADTANYAGQLIQAPIDVGVADYSLVYLETDGTWYNPKATVGYGPDKMLGICLAGGSILIEGDIGVSDDNSQGVYIPGADYGLPVYISDTTGRMTITAPSSTNNVVRIVGHIYYRSATNSSWWTMKFRPSNDWYVI
jgi:hypothetical protein